MAGDAADEEKGQLCLRVRNKDGGTYFYAVDLEKGTYSPILQSLEKDDEPLRHSNLLSFNSCIYTAGFHPVWIDAHGSCTCPVSSIKALKFDLRNPSLGWTEIPEIIFSDPILHPVICKNKIYSLNRVNSTTFDPNSNPPSLQVSPPLQFPSNQVPSNQLPQYPRLISDPCSDRVLMYFSKGGLYSFDPENEHQPFDCIDPRFRGYWGNRIALADGVLYFKPTCKPLVAYDLGAKKWLEVKWTAPYELNDEEEEWWDHFFHLGNGNMCLASYHSCSQILYTYSLKVEKALIGKRSLFVLVTPGVFKECLFEVDCAIVDIFAI